MSQDTLAQEPTVGTKVAGLVRRFLEWYFAHLRDVAGATVIAVILMLFGLNSYSPNSPAAVLVKTHVLLTVLVIALFIVFTFFAQWYLNHSVAPDGGSPRRPVSGLFRLSLISILAGVTALSVLLSLTLVLLTITRPGICPTWICPAPVHVAITQPKGVHDSHMEVYLVAVQSSTSVVTQPVTSATTASMPTNPETAVAAVKTGAPSSPEDAYRVIVGVHSLITGDSSIVIENVQLAIDATLPVPYPLNVWERGEARNYIANPYLVVYSGQPAGAVLNAEYRPVPFAHVKLSPGEADSLAIEVHANVISGLRFHVIVTYRVATQTQVHTLVLHTPLTVVFSATANWHAYTLSNGALVPVA